MFDVHSHKIENQEGGFILSIEGEPSVPGASSYKQLKQQEIPDSFIVVPYLDNLSAFLDKRIIYIHPRRNYFTVNDVYDYLKKSNAKLVIIDTFSSFFWNVQDYFYLLNTFKDKTFLLAHGGGYKIREFVELCRYRPNAFIDFSATQEIFGCVTGHKDLNCGVLEVIVHALSEPRIKSKVLFGSDNPEFSQMAAYEFYMGLNKKYPALIDENYLRLIDMIS